MLVQRQTSSSKRATLIVVLVVVLLVGGWTLWQDFLKPAPTTETGQDLSTLASERVRKVPEVNVNVFSDDRVVGQNFSTGTTFIEQETVTPRVAGTPIPPTNIRAKDAATGRKIVILWDLPVDPTIQGLIIYRSPNESAPATLLAQVSAGVDVFEDHTVTDGQAYWYLVKTFTKGTDGANVESQNTALVTTSSTDTLPPDAPAAVTVENVGDGASVKISWVSPRNEDFATIHIYRSETIGNVGALITDGTVKGTSFTDTNLTPGKTYYYTVMSVDASGNESGGLLYQTSGRTNPFGPGF